MLSRAAPVRGSDCVHLHLEGRDGEQADAHVATVPAQALLQLRVVLRHAGGLIPHLRSGRSVRNLPIPAASPIQLRLQVRGNIVF